MTTAYAIRKLRESKRDGFTCCILWRGRYHVYRTLADAEHALRNLTEFVNIAYIDNELEILTQR